MHIGIVSLFPAAVRQAAEMGVVGRALAAGRVELKLANPRDHASGRHRSVDDRPYGGGPGMVMQVAPLKAAIGALRSAAPAGAPVLLMSPQGRRFDQAEAQRLAGLEGMILVCGRYEGVDERLVELEIDEELSVGDYVLSGGELPALVVMDAVTRLLPGVLGDEMSAAQDSFVEGLLDCPHYTRPEVCEGLGVPDVLLGGDHQAVYRWRLKQALGRTWQRRPELLEARRLSAEERELLEEFKAETASGATN